MTGLVLLILAAAITTMGVSFLVRASRTPAASKQYTNAGAVVTGAGTLMILLSLVAIATGR